MEVPEAWLYVEFPDTVMTNPEYAPLLREWPSGMVTVAVVPEPVTVAPLTDIVSNMVPDVV